MQTLLLTSKLTPPAASRYSVDRTQICAQVFLAFGTKIVLVRAPAGFGKTTVMTQLFDRYRKEGTSVAWLNLDEADNDLPRFLSYLLVALKQHLRTNDELDEMQPERHVDTGYLTTLLANQLSERECPFVLFSMNSMSFAMRRCSPSSSKWPPGCSQCPTGARVAHVSEMGLGKMRRTAICWRSRPMSAVLGR